MNIRMESMLIDGSWTDAEDGGVVEIIDPATERVVACVPSATPGDLDRALHSSDRGWNVWRSTNAWDRSGVLRRAASILENRSDEIARVLTVEQGKPLAEARAEVAATCEQFEWFADEARRIYGRIVDARSNNQRLQVRREPVGPVAAFTPWNFPLLLASRKVAPALAAGCSVILKPAEEAPTAALEMARALVEAGLPNGVLNVVTGRPSMISEYLLNSPVIRKLTFTGSVEVGRHLLTLAAANINNVSMELGGHAPVLVFPDTDPQVAGFDCAMAKFRNGGQVCIAPTRFYVHEAIAAEFIDSFTRTVSGLRVGSGLDEGVQVGPLTTPRGVDSIEHMIRDAVHRGATVATGGARTNHECGYFFAPTVLTGVPESAMIMHAEPFGPVAPISTFASFDEAIARANGTQFGLAAYVITDDLTTAALASEELEVGIVGVNSFAVSAAQVPFGGVKASGIGSENGTEAMDSYLHAKSVVTGLRASESSLVAGSSIQ